MSPTIRAPRANELQLLRDIEWAAGTLFADIGFAEVAADEPASVETLAEYVHDGRAWVITNGNNDTPVGYAIIDIVDGLAHLEQLSVVPEHGRKGLGAALINHIAAWAAQHHYDAVTLTTFVDIPWNAPFYAKHGFRVMADQEIGPELTDLRLHEAEHGLDPTQRVCMRRDINA
jgi:GNAT superfamily N-acetyltransferase